MLRKLLASSLLVIVAFGTLATPTLAAPPDFELWAGPRERGIAQVEFIVEDGEVFIGPGGGGTSRTGTSDVVLTVGSTRIYAGPAARLPNVLYTREGDRLWQGPNTYRLIDAVYTLSDENRIYEGANTWGLANAKYTIRDNHIYEGPAVYRPNIVMTANINLEHTGPMTKLLLAVLLDNDLTGSAGTGSGSI